MKISMTGRLCALSAALALAPPAAAIATPSAAGIGAAPTHPVAQQSGTADARLAIILQRRPPPPKKPPPKHGH
jgi:hypothetical protein